MEFNFNKPSDSVESKELKTANPIETPTEVTELTDNTSDGLGNNHEIDKADEPTKAVVIYVGCSKWKDSKGKDWSNGETESFDIKEYEEREDLKFMVRYGEMKVSLV